jgi:LuxR family transcriptional regulator, maltose regulon positive regulatory protein
VRVTLILHDVHAIVAPAALDSLDALLAARPSGVRPVLCSRRNAPYALAALRSAGRLREVRADRLRFSADETSAMLPRGGVRLDEAQVAEVEAVTDGRPVSVRLVSAALRDQADPGSFLERMAAGLPPVADCLVGRCWPPCPPPTATCSRRSATVDRLRPPLRRWLEATLERCGTRGYGGE